MKYSSTHTYRQFLCWNASCHFLCCVMPSTTCTTRIGPTAFGWMIPYPTHNCKSFNRLFFFSSNGRTANVFPCTHGWVPYTFVRVRRDVHNVPSYKCCLSSFHYIMLWQYDITPCKVPGEPALPDIMDKGDTIQWHKGVWRGRFNNLERKSCSILERFCSLLWIAIPIIDNWHFFDTNIYLFMYLIIYLRKKSSAVSNWIF
jgi:hypothetical protein